MLNVGRRRTMTMAVLTGWSFMWVTSLVFLISTVESQSYTNKIWIGAMFDVGSEETKAGFGYEIMQQNEKQGRHNLQANDRVLDMTNAYSVATEMCSMMANGIFALFGTHRADTIDLIRSYTSVFQMPYITTSMAVNRSGQEMGYELYMRPYHTKGILNLIKFFGWNSLYYVYDSDEGLQRLQQLFDAVAEDEYVVKVNMVRVTDGDHAYQTIKGLDSKVEGNKHIILDLPTRDSEAIINRQKSETWRVNYHYLLAGFDIAELDLTDYSHGGINVTGFRLFNYKDINNFMDRWEDLDASYWVGAGRKKISYEAALAVDAIRLLTKALKHMVDRDHTVFESALKKGMGIDCDAEPVVKWKHGYDIMKTLREVEFKGLTGRIAFDNYGLRRDYSLEILVVTLNQGLSSLGTWHDDMLHLQQPQKVRGSKMDNTVSNRTRIVTSIATAPYLIVKSKDGEDGKTQYEGYCKDLAQEVADFVEFSYELRLVNDSKYGAEDENGEWNGMVGELVRNEADLAIAPLTITSQREKVIDFSKPFMSLGISIMIKKPEKEIPGVFSFMYPLSYEIWMCVIFAYIGVSVVLFLVSRFSPFEWHIEDNTDGPTVTNNFTIFNSLWFSLGAFMQQGCDIEPRSVSGRIVGSVWWFFTLIIISSYTANLAAFLTVERMQSPIESADDLAKQTEIKYGVVQSGSTENFFKTSSIPVYERMWSFMDSAEPSVIVTSNEEGMNRVRRSNGLYAFLVESTTNDYINQRKPCDTMKVGSNLDSKGYGIGTPLGSDLRDQITLAVLELREKGQLRKLENKWWIEKGECGKQSNKKKGDITSSRKLDNVAGLFYILIGGLCLALFVAVLEFVYKSKVEARRKKTSFSNAIRTKARLSIKGTPDHNGAQATAVGGPQDMPPANMSMSTYTYAPAAQLISLDGYADGNTHTQV